MITNDEIVKILNEYISESITTLDAPHTVMNDFHYVHIIALRTLVREAYSKGREDGYQAGKETSYAEGLFRTDSKALNRNDIHPVCRH